MALAPRLMEWSIDADQLCFQMGDVLFTNRLLKGNFPDYKSLVPRGQEQRVATDGEEVS